MTDSYTCGGSGGGGGGGGSGSCSSGGSCSSDHNNSEIIQIHNKYEYLIWTYQVATLTCKDCSYEMRCERFKRPIINEWSKWEKIDIDKCKHQKWSINNNTIKIVKEDTLFGSILCLLMGPGMDGIQYNRYIEAKGECNRCSTILNFKGDMKNNIKYTDCDNWKIIENN